MFDRLTVSRSTPSAPRSKNTSIDVRLAYRFVNGTSEENTGSSLFSRQITSHMSKPSCRINSGRIRSSRFFSQSL